MSRAKGIPTFPSPSRDRYDAENEAAFRKMVMNALRDLGSAARVAQETADRPPGYPEFVSVVPNGATGTLNVRHHNQRGTEILEVWLRGEVMGPDVLARSSSGLLARYDALNSLPFNAAHWETQPAATVDVSSSILRVFPNGNRIAVRYIGPGSESRTEGMIYAETRHAGNPTFDGVQEAGPALHVSDKDGPEGGDDMVTNYFYWQPGGSVARAGLVGINDGGFENIDRDDTTGNDYDVFNGHSLAVDGTDITGYEHEEDRSFAGTSANGEGYPGLWVRTSIASTGSENFRKWYWMASQFVTVTGVPTGGSVEVLNNADSVLASASETGGTATVDMIEEVWPGPVKIRVKNSGGTVLDTLTPADGVWGGDEYTFSPGEASADDWSLEAEVAVSTAETQEVALSDLDIGEDYDVSLRYRDQGQYNQGAGNTSDPTTWPAISQGQFTASAPAPAPVSAVWSRTASDAERITVTVTPAAGLTAYDIIIYRRVGMGSWSSVGTISGPHAGDVSLADTTISGETLYEYSAATDAPTESAKSAGIECWAGPAGTPDYESQQVLGAGYRVNCDNALSGAAVELHDTYDDSGGVTTASLRATGSADADFVDSGTLVNVPSPGLTFLAKLRYKLTQFTTDDYGQFTPEFNVTVPESE